jgi:hypothetical protein
VTIFPQLFIAVPLHWPLQAMPLSKQQPCGPAPPASQTPPVLQVQVFSWPQLFLIWPQLFPVQSIVMPSGVQHVPPDPPVTHTLPLRHVSSHVTVSPHVVIIVSQTVLPHALASGVQHVPLSRQTALLEHVPQTTGEPQLLIAVPHVCDPQAAEFISAGQQEFIEHVAPPSQFPHGIVLPQLSFTDPHRPTHHSAGGTGVQHSFERHVEPSMQLHSTVPLPHPFGAVVLHWLPHATTGGFGEQHVPPSRQMSVV